MLAAGASAADEPTFEPHAASYAVTRDGSEIGRIDVELARGEDDLWHYRFESRATAWYIRLLGVSATESAWFQWYRGAILPLTYHHVSREPGRDRYWQHRYDWETRTSDTRTHAGELELDLVDGMLDPLTLRLAAVERIAEQAPDFESFELTVLERDAIERQEYRFLRRERVEVAGRCYDAAVFRRFRKPGSSRNYTVWHARELDWQPVRIVHDDDGKPIELSLDRWRSDGSDRDLPAPGACDRSDGAAG